jgi:TPR repeat protein
MSSNSEAAEMMCCASCGIAEVDDIKLKKCNACKSVRYCSVNCQRDHRPQHKRACKKRVAELRDEILFKQPEISHYGDCPICLLPLSIDTNTFTMMACCSKWICHGCNYANQMRELDESLERKCAFCRHPIPKSQKKAEMNLMNRIEANDPAAMCAMGTFRYQEGNYKSAFEYFSKGAELGDAGAHYELSCLYRDGRGVEKDKKKQLHHLEEAAIGGDPEARNNLGCYEGGNGRTDRAIKHFIIAANLGHDNALKTVKSLFSTGRVSKEDFASALRAHQAAVDATKSPQREAAEAALQK